MSLSEVLLATTPRENAGSETAKRYDYQKDLCLFMLIELHHKQEDFVMLFDYFDDIALLDSDTNPQKIKFFQVKTKGAGHWLIKDFLKADTGKFSMVGKLYSNKVQFEAYTESLNFLTNASIKIDLPEENKDTASLYDFSAAQLKPAIIAKINEQLQSELNLSQLPAFEGITFFKVHGLSLTDSATHCIGALNKLFETLNPNFNGNASLAYKKIFNEIKIKTSKNLAGSQVTDLTQVIQEKGMSKKEFAAILEAAGLYQNPELIWSAIHTDLAAAGTGVAIISQYKSAWRDASVKALNQPNNIPLIKTLEHISQVVKSSLENPLSHAMNIIDLVNTISAASLPLPYNIFDDQFIKGAILKELYNE